MLRRRYDIWCLSVFTDIPEILNIQDISNIPNIPTNLEIPIIPEFPINYHSAHLEFVVQKRFSEKYFLIVPFYIIIIMQSY